jgi:hypothetical protein
MKRMPAAISLLLVIGLLVGCQPVPSASIKAQMSPTGPPTVEQLTDAGEECLVHVVLAPKVEGNLQGSVDTDYRIVVLHPCDPTPPGTYEENHALTGKFKGTLDGKDGTFEFFGSGKSVNGDYAAKWAIIPGSATGGLAGLTGMLDVQGKMLGGAGTYSVSGDYSLPPASR